MSLSLPYLVRFVVTPRQYELVHRRLNKKLECLKLPTPNEVYKSEASSRAAQLLVRQNVKLFLRVWGAAAVLNLLLKARKSTLNLSARTIAASIALIAAVFRFVSQISKRSHNRTLQAIAPIIASMATAPAFAMLPDSAKPFLALYTAAKATEYVYNFLDDKGYLEWKPRWIGSWLLFPVAMSQLFYTFIVHPEHCPRSFKLFMTSLSGSYLPQRPAGFPDSQHWPTDTEVLAGVAEISRLKFPAFKSPLVFRNQVWSESLQPVFSVLEYAHPGNSTMTGALLHPQENSEFKAYLETVGSNFSTTSRYIFPLYLAISILKNRTLTPQGALGSATSTLRTSTSIAMAAASAWAGIGLSQKLLGTRTLASTRFRVIGFMSGLWAFIDQVNGRARNFYLIRVAIFSYYNTFIAKRKGKPLFKGGDAVLFASALAVIATLFNRYPPSVASPTVRKALNWMQDGDQGDPSPLPHDST